MPVVDCLRSISAFWRTRISCFSASRRAVLFWNTKNAAASRPSMTLRNRISRIPTLMSFLPNEPPSLAVPPSWPFCPHASLLLQLRRRRRRLPLLGRPGGDLGVRVHHDLHLELPHLLIEVLVLVADHQVHVLQQLRPVQP